MSQGPTKEQQLEYELTEPVNGEELPYRKKDILK